MVTLLSLTGERLFRELVRQVAKRLLSYKYSPVLQKPPLVIRSYGATGVHSSWFNKITMGCGSTALFCKCA